MVNASYHCGLTEHDPLVWSDELLADIENWKYFLSADSELSSLLEEKNRTGRLFGSDTFYTVIEKLTGFDTRPGTPGRPIRKQ